MRGRRGTVQTMGAWLKLNDQAGPTVCTVCVSTDMRDTPIRFHPSLPLTISKKYKKFLMLRNKIRNPRPEYIEADKCLLRF